MGLTTNSVVYAQDFRDISSTKQMPLGVRGETRDGRKYRYALAGAVTLAPGKMNVAAVLVANHTNLLVQTAAAVGADSVRTTFGATAATADQYADGYLVVNDSAGEGINYLIRGHGAVASAGVITVNLDDPVKVALTTASEVSLQANPWSAIVVGPNALAHRSVGVNNVAITAAFFGWVQTGGDCSVLSDGIITKGAGVIPSDAVAGGVEIEVAGTVTQRVGYALEPTVDTEYRNIVLTIDN